MRLHYVSDEAPGIRRVRRGHGFCFVDGHGRPLRSPTALRRIRTLAIPPAWTDVWICPDTAGHIQASGRDRRGRKQYRYHPEWRAARDESKFDRLIAFGQALPQLRARIEADLALPGLPRDKILAAVVRILERSGLRVGNDEYARTNRHYGVTTLRNRHADVNGSRVHFEFIGKGGKHREVDVEDRRLARIVRRCQSLPGQELFQYVDADGTPRRVRSQDVNEYLRSVTGAEFTAKDIRTWVATVLAYQRFAACADGAATRRRMLAVIDEVASVLGNTRAICRSSYIHPAVMDGWAHGALRAPSPARARKHLDADEQRLLTLLRRERRRPRRERVMAPIASTARRPR